MIKSYKVDAESIINIRYMFDCNYNITVITLQLQLTIIYDILLVAIVIIALIL
jgi:acetolactate synthase regulatory subunit